MKKVLVSGLLLVALSAACVFMVYAGSEEKCGADKKLSRSRERYCKLMKDAKTEVTNTDNGVIVKVTSDDPEVVKLIQECWANRTACKAARSAGSEKTPAICGSKKKNGGTCPSMKAE